MAFLRFVVLIKFSALKQRRILFKTLIWVPKNLLWSFILWKFHKASQGSNEGSQEVKTPTISFDGGDNINWWQFLAYLQPLTNFDAKFILWNILESQEILYFLLYSYLLTKKYNLIPLR